MTLHWWMHWFWVTILLILLGQLSVNSALQLDEATNIDETPSVAPAPVAERRPKAMYIQNKPSPTPLSTTQRAVHSKLFVESLADRKLLPLHDMEPTNSSTVNETLKPESTISTTPIASTTVRPRDNQTSQEVSDVPVTPAEIVPSVTENVWSFETTLAELFPAASSGDLVQASEPEGRTDGKEDGSLQVGIIAGITLGAVAGVALASTAGFLLYRRRYLNKPQTLNDRCSNPDSSGYLDDSTIRENSEEMYSLDNDSFLNSLEAMTIQNYWTESVKHSKL